MAGTEGQRSLLVLSDGADTSKTPIDDGDREASRTPRCSPTSSPSSRTAPALDGAAAAGHGRPGSGHPVRPGRAPGRLRGRGRRPRPTRCWSPPRCRQASTRPRPRSRSRCRPRAARSAPRRSRPSNRPRPELRPRPIVDPALVGPLRRSGRARARARVPARPSWSPASTRAQRRRPGHAVHRDPGRGAAAPTRPRGLDTDVTFASAKETAANVLRRNKDLDARISARLQAAGSELKSSEWLLVHGAHLLRLRPASACCWAAATRSSASVFLVRRPVRAVDLPRLPAGRGAARRSTPACPTPCS